MRPRLLDAYCCQGGAARGYHDAGFDVVGVDIEPQPRYPYTFVQVDAIAYIAEYGHGFHVIHASPPCRRYSGTHVLRGNEHPDLIAATREAILATGKPYVIENVVGARSELRKPLMLCGAMFPGVEVYRHRLFECSFPVGIPKHPKHVAPQVKMGRPPQPGEWVQAVGNFSGVQQARDAMAMPWANREGLREAIPPAYTEHIGRQLMELFEEAVAA